MDSATSVSTDLETLSTMGVDPNAMIVFLIVTWFVSMLVAVLMLVSMWKLYAKAGKPGWAAIVPVYNVIVMLEIVGRPLWWIFLFFIPLANFVAAIILMLDFAKAYGKSTGYGVLMLFFPVIMYPVLAFGKNTQYVGPVAAEELAPTAPVKPQQ